MVKQKKAQKIQLNPIKCTLSQRKQLTKNEKLINFFSIDWVMFFFGHLLKGNHELFFAQYISKVKLTSSKSK